jgi:hypothetical protein
MLNAFDALIAAAQPARAPLAVGMASVVCCRGLASFRSACSIFFEAFASPAVGRRHHLFMGDRLELLDLARVVPHDGDA